MPFEEVESVSFSSSDHEVAATAAWEICRRLGLTEPQERSQRGEGLSVGTADGPWALGPDRPRTGTWMWLRVDPDGNGEAAASHPSLLYTLAAMMPGEAPQLQDGILLEPSFAWNRPLFDYTLTQTARSARGFDPEQHVRRMAECGFTHVEVNSLATHVPVEPGAPDEFYSQFYSYCPALSQFVDSSLTRGLYPHEYLHANLNRLKRLAGIARRYGLRPGLLCFEPRTLPSHFFDRYPTLRGARVDHPFRSHVPRYTLAQDHPLTRDHYRQMMRSLMQEVPDLAYLSVWTNDSGSGFEYTASLYVGRNGGPYVIREWRSHDKIAEAAGRSAVRWLRVLRDAAAETNPDFEVSLRLEPFKVEHDVIVDGLGDGLTAEVPSFLVRGYSLPYHHPRYPEQDSAAGTIHHRSLEDSEQETLEAWREKGFEAHMIYSPAAGFNLEPLLGIPFPGMLDEKLRAMRRAGVSRIAGIGGLLDTAAAPFCPNPEVIRAAQTMPDRPLDDVLRAAAARWAGTESAGDLLELWNAVDEAVSYLPILPLYGNFGFVWLRTWVRPLVPDIEAVPKEERLYYERFMVSTPNNPSINDLGRDVLFELITEESGRLMANQIDEHVLPRIDHVLQRLHDTEDRHGTPRGDDARQRRRSTRDRQGVVFFDLRDRVRALRCWSITQRNTCAWVAGVYGHIRSDDPGEKGELRKYLDRMIDLDLRNTRDLLDLWENAEAEFMLVSDVGETSYIYGENFGEHLRTKLRLTQAYRDREPRIDRDILWRV